MNRELLIFELGNSNFSVPLELVEEVVPCTPITEIPNSPPFLLGLTAVRGKVMGVIDASRRYGKGPGQNSHFIVCRVRGNLTAVAINHPVVAGAVTARPLAAGEYNSLKDSSRVDEKFLKGGFELMELKEGEAEPVATGICFLEVETDLFVSAEMASRIGEA